MSYYHYLATGILLLIMAIATLKILAKEQKGFLNLASNILIAVLVVEFTVWSVDTVLWLVVQLAQYLSVPPFSELAPGLSAAPRTDPYSNSTSAEYGWLHCGGPGAGHFVKMVHNGVEYGIMQAYAEGFNILHHGNLGSNYTKEGDAEVARWKTRGITNTILTVLK